MREKYVWLAIAVLTALLLMKACSLYERRAVAGENPGPPLRTEIAKQVYSEKAYDAQWEELDKWRVNIQKRVDSGTPLLEKDFDLYFNDRFFAHRLDPFIEIEKVHRQVSEVFNEPEKELFEGYWAKWFAKRMKLAEFRTELLKTDKGVTMTIDVPGLDAGTADVDIKDGRIKVAFSARTSYDEKRPGWAIKREFMESHVKIMPIPEYAAAGTGRSEIDGERIIIRFDLK